MSGMGPPQADPCRQEAHGLQSVGFIAGQSNTGPLTVDPCHPSGVIHRFRCNRALARAVSIGLQRAGTFQLFTLNGSRLQRMEKSRAQAAVFIHRMRNELRLAIMVSGVSATSIAFTTSERRW